MARRRLAVTLAAVAVFVAALCTAIVVVTGRRAPSLRCPVSAKLVPSCGLLWGVTTEPNTLAAVRSADRAAGTRFNLVYRFHDLDDHFPTADERAVLADGRTLHVTIAPTIFGSAQVVTWRQIASGAFDSSLSAQARGVAALHVPVFVTFDHESDRPDRSVRGGPADFVAAWRHVHELYARAGATQAVWVWVVTGYPPFFAAAGRIWPGNGYVDWIAWEAYNGSGCAQGAVTPAAYQSFGQAALGFYNWVHTAGARAGIDPDKPMMISEAGSVIYPDSPARTARWYRGIASVVAGHPQIKAVTLFDRRGNGVCDYRFDHAADVVRAAIGRAGAELHYSLVSTPRPPA